MIEQKPEDEAWRFKVVQRKLLFSSLAVVSQQRCIVGAAVLSQTTTTVSAGVIKAAHLS